MWVEGSRGEGKAGVNLFMETRVSLLFLGSDHVHNMLLVLLSQTHVSSVSSALQEMTTPGYFDALLISPLKSATSPANFPKRWHHFPVKRGYL